MKSLSSSACVSVLLSNRCYGSFLRWLIELDGHRQTMFTPQNLHHSIECLIPLEFTIHKALRVICAGRNLSSIDVEGSLRRYRLQEIRKDLTAACTLRCETWLTIWRRLRQVGQIFPPFIQDSLTLLGSPAPPTVVEGDSDRVERLDVRGTHASSPRVHQGGEDPRAKIGSFPSSFDPLLSLHSQNGAQERGKNYQAVTYCERGGRTSTCGVGCSGNERYGVEQHTAPSAIFRHFAMGARGASA